MSAPIIRCMRTVIHNVLNGFTKVRICHKCFLTVFVAVRPSWINSSLAFAAALSHEKVNPTNPTASLSHACLIRNASSAAVDASSTVLSQVVASIINIEREYKQAVEVLIELLEFQLEITGHGIQEEKLWEDIVAARHRLNTISKTQQELDMLYSSVEKLMDASGEVAFFAGAEYAVTSTGERVHSAKTYIDQVKAESRQAMDTLQELEVKVIEVTARKAKEEEERMKAEATKDAAESENSDNVRTETSPS